MSTILQCRSCLREHTWDRDKHAEPVPCICGTRWSDPWRVIKAFTPRGSGRVTLITHKGRQELRGPDWTPREDRWVKDPPPTTGEAR